MKMSARLPTLVDEGRIDTVDSAGNQHASGMLLRDVANLRDDFSRSAPGLRHTAYGAEIRALYERGAVGLRGLMREIDDALAEQAARQARLL